MDEKPPVLPAAVSPRLGSASPPVKPSRDHGVVDERDLDQAYKYLEAKDHGTTDVEALNLKALRRKIDWRIVPIMFACYTMQFIDKVLLNVS